MVLGGAVQPTCLKNGSISGSNESQGKEARGRGSRYRRRGSRKAPDTSLICYSKKGDCPGGKIEGGLSETYQKKERRIVSDAI